MDISTEERRKAFSHWIRTGRLPGVRNADGVELKFNPWHDPENGRFTFADTGRRWSGGGFSGGGGGRFGGGGATGTYPWPDKPKSTPPKASTHHSSTTAPAAVNRTIARPSATEQASQHFIRNGYEFKVDVDGRVRGASGFLTGSEVQGRSATNQSKAGGGDRRSDDDGGHYIAARFNGPTDAFNHFAQNANFNRGRYRVLEDEWARDRKARKKVFVNIVPTYHGKSLRPSVIDVWFTVDGREKSQKFFNEREGVRRGK